MGPVAGTPPLVGFEEVEGQGEKRAPGVELARSRLDQGVNEGRYGADFREVRGRVAGAHLDRAEAGGGPDVPADFVVFADGADADEVPGDPFKVAP